MMDFVIKLINNTTFLTVIAGVLVYVISQLILECIINPRNIYVKKESRRIRKTIIFGR